MRLGEQIRTIRSKENLTQEQLGQKMNVTRQAIYKWENGKGYPDIQNLIKISELFEISLDELIKGDSSFQSKIKVKGGTGMFSNRNFLSSLNYFSMFFAPFIFPLLTMIFGHEEMRWHGKRACISHLIPITTFILMILIYGGIHLVSTQVEGVGVPNSTVQGSSMVILALITIGVAIWNIKEGIRQIREILGGGNAYEA
ncbi:helix-turn-helix domain-containing protein [Paenibacillus sp. 1P07SE]|uniref:helix-turn-helix domain-containing protein n=1 Tax=Paenibacillus sp. 1P07SE TaxID=3132209 RepID=UPI0039A41B7A